MAVKLRQRNGKGWVYSSHHGREQWVYGTKRTAGTSKAPALSADLWLSLHYPP